ncbi:MAG: hypothetical protein AAB601_03085, partial [Patescibacteria group bacterium]
VFALGIILAGLSFSIRRLWCVGFPLFGAGWVLMTRAPCSIRVVNERPLLLLVRNALFFTFAFSCFLWWVVLLVG